VKAINNKKEIRIKTVPTILCERSSCISFFTSTFSTLSGFIFEVSAFLVFLVFVRVVAIDSKDRKWNIVLFLRKKVTKRFLSSASVSSSSRRITLQIQQMNK
jgi:hypothetical protein